MDIIVAQFGQLDSLLVNHVSMRIKLLGHRLTLILLLSVCNQQPMSMFLIDILRCNF
jgi:hypothetical protein